MNLAGKYIIFNKNNTETIVKFLYSKGYSWASTIGHDLEQTLEVFKMTMDNCYEEKYIQFKNNLFYFNNQIPPLKYINIKLLIREDKLKRILKTK